MTRFTYPGPRVCPECSQGKHANCDGTAWNEVLDEIDTCQCEQGECAST